MVCRGLTCSCSCRLRHWADSPPPGLSPGCRRQRCRRRCWTGRTEVALAPPLPTAPAPPVAAAPDSSTPPAKCQLLFPPLPTSKHSTVSSHPVRCQFPTHSLSAPIPSAANLQPIHSQLPIRPLSTSNPSTVSSCSLRYQFPTHSLPAPIPSAAHLQPIHCQLPIPPLSSWVKWCSANSPERRKLRSKKIKVLSAKVSPS